MEGKKAIVHKMILMQGSQAAKHLELYRKPNVNVASLFMCDTKGSEVHCTHALKFITIVQCCIYLIMSYYVLVYSITMHF